jgi:hypothetical protein
MQRHLELAAGQLAALKPGKTLRQHVNARTRASVKAMLTHHRWTRRNIGLPTPAETWRRLAGRTVPEIAGLARRVLGWRL